MQHLSNLACSRTVQPLRVPQRQAGFASLEGVLIGTTVAIIALCIALAGSVGAIIVFCSH